MASVPTSGRRARWSLTPTHRPYVKTITPDEMAGTWTQVDAYAKWFQTKYLSADDETGSTAIMVDPWTWNLGYRDTLREYVP